MKVKVLGIQSVDYVSRKTGNPVKGVTLHSAFKDAQVEGESVSSIFVSDNLNLKCVAEIRPGMLVDVEYNNRGYVCDLAICKQSSAFLHFSLCWLFYPGSASPLWVQSRISLSTLSSRPDSGLDSSLCGIPTFCHIPCWGWLVKPP